MSEEDLFSIPTAQTPLRSNVPEMSVCDLSFSLKKTLEETYNRVRVRGELSGIKLASSGHLYGDLKDSEACINIVCWRSSMNKLSVRPEDGMDVVVTGKVTSYPKNSRYQLVIEQIELAGEGALLKLLEDRKRKLAAEGLFDPSRKKPLPFLPRLIGVVTSPTGAVIRDILHRVRERFPCPVLVWPVLVQGEGAAQQIAAALRGFNALPEKSSSGPCRPDVLILARGGGSLEDLMAFNEEAVVRAIAESQIPVISAIGHETDTTLADFAADLRAPTPTGAAEMAVPVRLELYTQVMALSGRLLEAASRQKETLLLRLEKAAARLGAPETMLHMKAQHTDRLSDQLTHAHEHGLSLRRDRVNRIRIPHPGQLVEIKARGLGAQEGRLNAAVERLRARAEGRLAGLSVRPPLPLLERYDAEARRAGERLQTGSLFSLNEAQKTLSQTVRLLETLSTHRILERGYAIVRGEHGKIIPDAMLAETETTLEIEFRGGKRVQATPISQKSTH